MYTSLFKNILDRFCAFILLVMLFIPFIVVGILIKLDSRGTVFYRQQRIGRNGHLFHIWKFRSMCSDADKIGSYSTSVNDRRVTKFGHIIRKSSIDELPQVINILIGDMSFIGPRPDVPAQRSDYSDEEFVRRHRVKPGLTGLSQSLKRHGGTKKMRKTMDIFYNEHVSLCLDIKIVFDTVKILRKGSY